MTNRRYDEILTSLKGLDMKTKSRIHLGLNASATCAMVIGLVSSSVAQEDFATIVKRLESEKPGFAERHQKLLSERYDLADRPTDGVTMSVIRIAQAVETLWHSAFVPGANRDD